MMLIACAGKDDYHQRRKRGNSEGCGSTELPQLMTKMTMKTHDNQPTNGRLLKTSTVVVVVVNSGWRCKQQDNAPSVYLLFWVQQKVFRYNRL